MRCGFKRIKAQITTPEYVIFTANRGVIVGCAHALIPERDAVLNTTLYRVPRPHRTILSTRNDETCQSCHLGWGSRDQGFAAPRPLPNTCTKMARCTFLPLQPVMWRATMPGYYGGKEE